jgi:pilus assembly protein Flp/PilA
VNHCKLKEFPAAVCVAGKIDPVERDKKTNVSVVRPLLRDESGQDLIEYALVAALVGLGAVVAMKGLKNSIANAFNGVGTSLANA